MSSQKQIEFGALYQTIKDERDIEILPAGTIVFPLGFLAFTGDSIVMCRGKIDGINRLLLIFRDNLTKLYTREELLNALTL